MERATRERLTGAVILVAALAILVPEMLSGPRGDGQSAGEADTLADTGPPLTTYELPLNPQGTSQAMRLSGPSEDPAAEDDAASAPVTGADSTAPATTSASPDEAAGGRRTDASEVARVAADAPRPAPSSSQAPSPAATPPRPGPAAAAAPAAGNWWVQLGSFASEQNARGLASGLRERGYRIEVSKVRSGGRDLYRVRAGPEKDRDAATALRGRLAAAGQQGTLVAP